MLERAPTLICVFSTKRTQTPHMRTFALSYQSALLANLVGLIHTKYNIYTRWYISYVCWLGDCKATEMKNAQGVRLCVAIAQTTIAPTTWGWWLAGAVTLFCL